MIKPKILALDDKKEYSLTVEILGKLNGWSSYGFCLYSLLKAIKMVMIHTNQVLMLLLSH